MRVRGGVAPLGAGARLQVMRPLIQDTLLRARGYPRAEEEREGCGGQRVRRKCAHAGVEAGRGWAAFRLKAAREKLAPAREARKDAESPEEPSRAMSRIADRLRFRGEDRRRTTHPDPERPT